MWRKPVPASSGRILWLLTKSNNGTPRFVVGGLVIAEKVFIHGGARSRLRENARVARTGKDEKRTSSSQPHRLTTVRTPLPIVASQVPLISLLSGYSLQCSSFYYYHSCLSPGRVVDRCRSTGSFVMSVLLETSLGDIVIDLLVDESPKTCEK